MSGAVEEDVSDGPGAVASVRLLGPVQLVTTAGRTIEVPGSSQRRLLGLLALHEGRTVRAELLSEVLGVSSGGLRKIVSRLRSLVGDEHVRTDPVGYALTLDVDAARFADALRDAETAADRLGALDEALALWHGDVLDEFATEDWAVGEVARLNELRFTAMGDRIGLLIDTGRPADALADCATLIAAQPLADRPRALQLRALAAVGRPTDAMRAYQLYRTLLAEEVGTEPSAMLRDVEHRIAVGWDGIDEMARSDESRQRRAIDRSGDGAQAAHSLPRPAGGWVGSFDAIKRVVEDLPTRRVVTLTGPGGIGKTRSAIEIGRRCIDAFDDGVWLVELAPVAEPDGVVAAFASALGVPKQPNLSMFESIVDWMGGRSMLVIVDNCEHVIDAAARLIDAIVHGNDTVVVLATSRERLGVDGERVVTVPTLGPSDSVELFVERARDLDASMEPTTDDLATITAICERIDGIPLAIELAAARARSLSLDDLLARLDDRFALLRRTRGDGPAHKRTLRDTIDWSYQLLGPDEQILFDRLSIFAGSFDLEAIESVCAGPPLDARSIVELVGSLVDKSMVTVERRDATLRYRLLDSLRHFGEQQLRSRGATEEVASRHLAHYVAVAERANAAWFSPAQVDADAVFDREWDNLRAAHATAVTNRSDRALGDRLLIASIAHASYRMRTEHGDWSDRAVDPRTYESPPDAFLTGWTAWWSMVTGRHDRAIELAEQGVRSATSGDRRGAALCHGVASFSYWSSARRAEGRVHIDALSPMLGSLDAWAEYNARRALFTFAAGVGIEDEANRIADIAETIGAPSLIASARFYQGTAKMYLGRDGDLAAATALHEEGIALARSARADFAESQNLHGLSRVKLSVGDDDAADVCAMTLQRLYDLRYWLYLWPVIDGVALLLARRGELDAAARVMGHLDAHVPAWHAAPRSTTRALVSESAAAAKFEAIGRAMPREALVRFVVERLGAPTPDVPD